MEKNKNGVRIIFHIDMNAYFCSVAEILDPNLKGKAFAIGREGTTKGVLSTASYEARKYGLHSAMSTAEAYKILPSLLVIHLDYKHYIDYHYKFVNLIKEYTNLIQVASIDEVYADMTEISKIKHPITLAHEIQDRLVKEYQLKCSIGIAPTLFLAKMASDIKKPLGITVIRRREIKDILYGLSVKDIYGIGKKTYPRLIDNGIKTIGEFMDPNNRYKVIDLVGENTYLYAYNSLIGNSSNVVDPDKYSESKSISEMRTYDIPISSLDECLLEIRKLSRSVFKRLIDENYYYKTVNITLRDISFRTITRQKTLNEYSQDPYLFNDLIYELLSENFNDLEYRLIGCGLSNLVKENKLEKEYNLFTISEEDEENKEINKKQNIDDLIKEFQEKYGKLALYRKKDEN